MRMLFTLSLCLFIFNSAFSQNCGGNIIVGATSGFLDPDADGMITASGTGFTDCISGYVNEMLEFEDLRTGCASCETPWTAIPLGTETTGDLWASGGGCGATEIVPDATTGAYAYYTIIDADGNCATADLMLVMRVRVDRNTSGSFSYSLLIDTDRLLGTADPDGIQCASKIANAGFEYEVVANPANNKNIEVHDINGVIGSSILVAAYPNTTHYNQAYACRSLCDGGCAQNSNAVYHTFAIELSVIGKSCADKAYTFAGATASSGNGTVSSNTSIADLGGFEGNDCSVADACNCCVECADVNSPYYCAGNLDGCLMACGTACVAEGNSSATFAIELISFEGSPINEGIELRWEVAAEKNNEFYEVQRSLDGVNFSSIGRIEGAGTTDQQLSYGLIDEQPYKGLNYYRLKYVDTYGTVEYSIVIAVNYMEEQSAEVNVFPTKFENELNVNINLAQDGIWDLEIYNLYGQLVQHKSWDLQAGYVYRSLNTTELSAGTYVLLIKERGSSIQSTHRIIKL